MYQNILLATDGSALAGNGVAHGLRLAKALRAKTTVVTVTEPFAAKSIGLLESAVLGATVAEINDAAKHAALQRLQAVGDQASLAGVECDLVHLIERIPPAQGILETAAVKKCDLIVMGSRGLGGMQGLLTGSQAFEVVTRAQVPVLIVRAQPEPSGESSSPDRLSLGTATTYSNILIATDGSPLAQKGVDQGLALAKHLRASVTFVVASGLASGIGLEGVGPIGLFAGHSEIIRETEGAAEQILRHCEDQAAALGVVHEVVHLRNEIAADAILDTAARHRCDLIVMSSHGYRGIERFMLGSQAYAVINRAKIPVLVVR